MARASSTFEAACLQGPLGVAGTTNIIPYFAVNTADPGVTGAGEIVGGSYTRVAETLAVAGGTASNTISLAVAIPAATTCSYVSHWSAITGGTYGVGAAMGSSVTFNTAGTLTFAVAADTISVS